MPKFSIIVPMYNVEQYIAECIESVINQTYRDLELILVDDESMDGTLQIAKQYAKRDNRIIIIEKKHGGLPQTRNFGLNVCRGEYVVLLDGDDYFNTEHLEKAVQVLDQYRCDMCIANNHINFTQNESTVVELFPFHSEMNEYSLEKCLEIIFAQENKLPAAAVLTIYRKEFMDKNLIRYEESYLCSEDLDIFLHSISKTTTIKFIGHEFYYYRQDNLGAMTKNMSGEMYLSRLSIYKKWFDYYNGKCLGKFDCNKITAIIQRDFKQNITGVLTLPSRTDKTAKTVKKYVMDNAYIWSKRKYVFISVMQFYIAILYHRTYMLYKKCVDYCNDCAKF